MLCKNNNDKSASKEQKNVNLMLIMLGVWLGNLQVADYNYLLTIDIRIYVSILLLIYCCRKIETIKVLRIGYYRRETKEEKRIKGKEKH